jgi:hypothetical protein
MKVIEWLTGNEWLIQGWYNGLGINKGY